MNMQADARFNANFPQRRRRRERQKVCLRKPSFYEKFTTRSWRVALPQAKCVAAGGTWEIRAGNLFDRWRNIRAVSFVYTGAARNAVVPGKIQKKPRGGSRGAMTRSLS